MKTVNYIIPICKLDDNDYQYRIDNLNYIFSHFLEKQINVKIKLILIEQSIDGKFYYLENLKFPESVSVVKLACEYPVFNKCWLNNIAAKHVKDENIIFAESDTYSLNNSYMNNLLEHVDNLGLGWCMGWNRLFSMDNNGSEKSIHLKKGKGAEGGIVYFKKAFFNDIGGYNEWIMSLGGMDNEIVARATFMTCYNLFPEAIYHRWHPLSIAKKIDERRKRNSDIFKYTKQNPKEIIDFLKSFKNGNTKNPLCFEGAYTI